MPKNYCIMQIWAESGTSALPICNYSQILYQFLTFTQNLKRSRLLVKPVSSAISLMPTATYELPYEGAKEMLLVDDVDSREFLCNLFLSMYDELPAPKKKKNPSKK